MGISNRVTTHTERAEGSSGGFEQSGENGWELVSAYMNQDLVNYIFKKPTQELGRAKRKIPSEG